MDRMKTFLIYFLLLIGFFFLSYVLENGLIANMYAPINGNIATATGDNKDISITMGDSTATSVNGYINFKVKNNTENTKERCYAKVDLFNDKGLLAATEYIEIDDLKPGEEREISAKFKANNIASYNVSIVDELPDKSNIINILGWEIDLSNIFGFDLTKILGDKFPGLFNKEGLKAKGLNMWYWFRGVLSSVPWWAYMIAGGIVLWHMPSRFLFGLFPF